MGTKHPKLNRGLISFIEKQHLFFVGTAAPDGRVNISPKGLDSLRVIDENRLVWLNLTGSGNETAAHLKETKRMTIMFASFDKAPLILKLYGQATTINYSHEKWSELIDLFPEHPGARQIFDVTIDLVITSCGEAVPFYDFVGNRESLTAWSEEKGPDGIRDYWESTNQVSIDGKPTGILD
jgi:hypothetical protein